MDHGHLWFSDFIYRFQTNVCVVNLCVKFEEKNNINYNS